MKKQLIGFALAIFLLACAPQIASASIISNIVNFFSFSSAPSASSNSPAIPPIPVRELTVDTLNKSLFLDETNSTDRDGKLLEYNNSSVQIKDWKIKYEWKGHNRKQCDPPVLNLSFDKKDSRGNPRALFNGRTTYPGSSELEYQKIRMIPDCDTWNDYGTYDSNVGFHGVSNVLLREYLISDLMRYYGVPTADVIGVANVRFITPDPLYTGKVFRYLLVQRPKEQDDQMPFTKQFNLNPTLYESGDTSEWSPDWDGLVQTTSIAGRPTVVPLVNKLTQQKVNLTLDPQVAVTTDLLSNFLTLDDMGLLHNEDYGVDKNTGKGIIIPHGFDASFTCYVNTPNPYGVLKNMPDTDPLKGAYKTAISNAYQRVFGSSASLNRMLAAVDAFPVEVSGKEMTKEFLKLSFYQYVKMAGSEEYAESVGIPQMSLATTLPFASEAEFKIHLQQFNNNCQRVLDPLPGVTVRVSPKPQFNVISQWGNDVLHASFSVLVTAGATDLLVAKQGAFEGEIKGETVPQDDSFGGGGWASYGRPSTIPTSVGPYYTIPAGTTAVFPVEFTSYGSKIKDKYKAILKSFKPNSRAQTITAIANNTTDSILYGIDASVTVTSPKADEAIDPNAPTLHIAWETKINDPATEQYANRARVQLTLFKIENNNSYFINGMDLNSNAGTYDWKQNQFMSEGDYRLVVKVVIGEKDLTIPGSSPIFHVIQKRSTFSVSLDEKPQLSLSYSPLNRESELSAKFPITITAGDSNITLLKNGSQVVLTNSNPDSIPTPRVYVGAIAEPNDNLRPIAIGHDQFDREIFTIPARSSFKFLLTGKSDPRVMSPGTYTATLGQVGILDGIKMPLPPDASNGVTIIGETAPYVTSLTEGTACESMVVRGVRFHPTNNTLYLKNIESGAVREFTNIRSSEGGTKIDFLAGNTNITSGRYYLSVINAALGQEAGRSNALFYSPGEHTNKCPQESELTGLCYSTPAVAYVGDKVYWQVAQSGGRSPFNYSWTGTDNLAASGTPAIKTYSTAGIKNVTVTISSPRQSITQTCSKDIKPKPITESVLTGLCYSTPATARVGDVVNWQVAQSGGKSPFTYKWTGGDNLSGNTSYVPKTYSTPGIKKATVTISSPEQSITQSCSKEIGSAITLPTYSPSYSPVYSEFPSESPSYSPVYTIPPVSSPSSSPSYSDVPSDSPSESPVSSAGSHNFVATVFYSVGDFLDSIF